MAETPKNSEPSKRTESWWSKNWFYITLVLVAVIGGGCAFTLPYHVQREGDNIWSLRQAILAATGGVLAILTLWENRRKNIQEKEKNDQDHTRQVHAERRARYAKAVEQLADEKAPIRLGGVYTLVKLIDEWLADEKTLPNEEERREEGQVIVNSLCAYIRSPFDLASKTEVLSQNEAPESYEGGIQQFTKDQARFREEKEIRLTIMDAIKARLNVSTITQEEKTEKLLKGSWSDFDYEFSNTIFFYSIDFRNSHFNASSNFIQATFTEASFSRAKFTQNANFSGATFTKYANFSGATFTKNANFSATNFTKFAEFSEATFTQNADFSEATFTEYASFSEVTFIGYANFSAAKFTRLAHFFRAKFTEYANFSAAKFTEASFSEVTFIGYANFSAATFTQNANFFRAGFTEATFSRAKFIRFAEFSGAKFTEASFSRAKFTEATFSRAKFTEASFSAATFTQNAEFSEAKFTRLAHFFRAKFTEASFSRAKFTKNANFSAAKFIGYAKFSEAKFTQNADFSAATFTQNADFSGTIFTWNADFFGARFSRKVDPEDYNFKVSHNSPYKIEAEEQEYNGINFTIPKGAILFDPDEYSGQKFPNNT